MSNKIYDEHYTENLFDQKWKHIHVPLMTSFLRWVFFIITNTSCLYIFKFISRRCGIGIETVTGYQNDSPTTQFQTVTPVSQVYTSGIKKD
jgi:predicted Zn-dependent protease